MVVPSSVGHPGKERSGTRWLRRPPCPETHVAAAERGRCAFPRLSQASAPRSPRLQLPSAPARRARRLGCDPEITTTSAYVRPSIRAKKPGVLPRGVAAKLAGAGSGQRAGTLPSADENPLGREGLGEHLGAEGPQRVVDGVHDGGGRAGGAGLARALGAQQRFARGSLDVADLDVGHLRRHRHQVVGHGADQQLALGRSRCSARRARRPGPARCRRAPARRPASG